MKVEGLTDAIIVPISTDKPDIPEKVLSKWQNIVDLMARIVKVPSGQITRFTEENLEIFIASRDTGNPFKNNDKAPLGFGMFCETTVGKRRQLTVADIRPSEYWKNNPLTETGMLSYIGIPIEWEDGEVFGTFCFLDNKSNKFSPPFRELIIQFKEIIEADLQLVLLYQELQKRLTAQEMLVREAHHRINNHFSMLIGYIQLRVSEREGDRNVHDILLDVQNRIRSISLIHEKLCRTSDERLPPLDEYVKQLCTHMITDISRIRIDVYYEIEPLEPSMEITVAIGLIVSELLTNSIKYAFSGNESPRIDIGIRRGTEGKLLLWYRDNGVGLPAGFDIATSGSIGMSLIRMQVEQLHGELRIDRSNGTEFRIAIEG